MTLRNSPGSKRNGYVITPEDFVDISVQNYRTRRLLNFFTFITSNITNDKTIQG